MEKKTMGSFMAALRKSNGLTQQQVADRLNVSNKTVSKWECNEGYPEISMLPVIAELYSVSVDELLRGERIPKSFTEENKKVKSTERIKYLIEKATVKFTNSSIIAIILGIATLILTYTICDIVYNYNVLWVGYAIILILCSVSITVSLIAFNNFISGLHNDDIIEKESIEEKIKKCIKYITVITFLSVVTLSGLILDVLMDAPSNLFAALPATAVLGGVIAYFIRSFLYKKFNITLSELSPEQKIYRKKHIKITAIILSVVTLISVLMPFVIAYIDSQTVSSFNFNDAVGYQYSTQEEAEREYYKLKGSVTGEKTLYNIIYEEYDENTGTYTLYLNEIFYLYKKEEDGYSSITSGPVSSVTEEITQNFSSYEEMEKFKDENTYNDENFDRELLGKDITFDDKNLTVSYKFKTNYLNGVLDILSAFVIIGACVIIVIFIISVVIYFKKKKSFIK